VAHDFGLGIRHGAAAGFFSARLARS
jgi:hypothetical protein